MTATTAGDAGRAPAFPIETPFGPAALTYFVRDRALAHADALTVNRIPVEVRLHLRRDHVGRLAVDGLHAYRVGDRWTPITDNMQRRLIDALRRLANAHAAAHPAALAAADAADRLRSSAALESEAARLEAQAAAKRDEAARLRAA